MQGGTPALLRAMQVLLWTSETLGFLPPFQRNPMAKLELKPSQDWGLEYSNPPVSDALPAPGWEGGDLKSHLTPGAEAGGHRGHGEEGRRCSG